MFILRALLDSVGALPGDLTYNTDVVRSMFPPPASAQPMDALGRSSSTPAGRTAAVIARQLAIHQRLFVMSEGYSTADTRTVRSVDVSELDELYDIVNEACSTNLFALRPPEQQQADNEEDEEAVDAQVHSDAQEVEEVELDDASAAAGEDYSVDGASTASMPPGRRLLLKALLKTCTVAELRYLFNNLPPNMQTVWALLSRGP